VFSAVFFRRRLPALEIDIIWNRLLGFVRQC
jgi:hypothetical protein